MTTQILGENCTIILHNGTLIEIDEEFNMLWIHPKGLLTKDSYRINLKYKTIDVHVGADFKP